MRDTIKNDGLNELITELSKSFDKLKEGLNQIKDPDIIDNVSQALISRSIQKTIAIYSYGGNKDEIKASFLIAIDIFNTHFKWLGIEQGYGDYDYMVWMVSLGVLCDIELEGFKRITAIIERDNAKDKLLDFIIKSKQDDWAGDANNYIQAIPYAKTENIKTDKDIKQYLDKVWYQGHDEAYWHDMHKNKNANRYFGYWAWEVAAIAKIKGIDDEKLKEQLFYPYDAVHW